MLRLRFNTKEPKIIHMTNREKILDDVARLAGGAMGALNDASQSARAAARARIDEWAQDMDLVPREDFEKLELMLIEAREDQKILEERLSKLEKKIT